MTRASARGFTLFELAMSLIIILILASMWPYAISEVNNTRYVSAENDALAMANGILGTRDVNGMLGDLGYIPSADTLLELARPRSDFPLRGSLRGVSYGWQGPYALPGVGYGGVNSEGFVVDPWGTGWMMPTGTKVAVTSLGPNRRPLGTGGTGSDDIQAPAYPPFDTKGTLLVRAFDPAGVALNHEQVEVKVSNPRFDNPTGIEYLTCAPNVWVDDQCLVAALFQGQHVVTVSGLDGGPWEGARGYARVYVGGATKSAVSVRLSMWQGVP